MKDGSGSVLTTWDIKITRTAKSASVCGFCINYVGYKVWSEIEQMLEQDSSVLTTWDIKFSESSVSMPVTVRSVLTTWDIKIEAISDVLEIAFGSVLTTWDIKASNTFKSSPINVPSFCINYVGYKGGS